MMRKRIFTYKFVFKWDDGTEDETEFCAANIEEAMKLFTHWCHDDMQIPYTPAVHPFIEYNADDAAEYGERYFANPCPGYVYKDLVCIKAVAEKHGCKPDEVKTYLEDAWSFTEDYDPASLPFGPAECGFYIDGQPEWVY